MALATPIFWILDYGLWISSSFDYTTYMEDLWFVTTGKNPRLSEAELNAQLPFLGSGPYMINSVTDSVFEIKGQYLSPEKLDRLGGIIKAGRVVCVVAPSRLEDTIFQILAETSSSRVDFGLSATNGFNGHQLMSLALRLKKSFKHRGWSSRVFYPQEGTEISAVVTQKQLLSKGGTEIYLMKKGSDWQIGKIEWSHDFEDWGRREFEKPYADRQRGMLPHKLARIMINLTGVKLDKAVTVFDPFCGLGAVLTEARELGCQYLGSDIDNKAVEGARVNLGLLKSDMSIWQNDAQSVTLPKEYKAGGLVIVTEPDLGPYWHERPNSTQINAEVTRLANLYLECLRHWRRMIPDRTPIVMIMPVIEGTSVWTVLVDSLKNLKYSTNVRPIRYERVGQVVKRDIVKLVAV